MKKVLFLFWSLIASFCAIAQLEVIDGSFKEVAGFVNLNSNKMFDDNDKPYAVLKIKTINISSKERHELNFGGDAQTFFEVEYKDGEVWLYISYYASYIKISHEEFSSTEFHFPFDMKPKCGYELVLVKKYSQQSDDVGYITVKSVPTGAELMIDNIMVGYTPYLSESLIVGNHKISVHLDGYEPEAKRVNIEIEEEKEIVFDLSLQNGNNSLSKNASLNDYKTFTINGISFNMVFIKGGTFKMGGTQEQVFDVNQNEMPVHDVTLTDYFIGEFEVTQELWRAVMGDNPSYFKGDNYPVENISWNDVQKFLKKLNKKTGYYFRLPTEAEWEYAARGGYKSNGYKYSGSNNIEIVAWYSNNSGGHTNPVGSKMPNELGIYDMSGNVWEWCQDWFDLYKSNKQKDPLGAQSGLYRITRGGGWNYRNMSCRVSKRDGIIPELKYNNIGFRIVYVP